MKYRTIVADPPWPLRWDGGSGGRRRNRTPLSYPLMGIDEIAALVTPVEKDATLLLWVVQEVLHSGEARAVAQAWGFPRRVGEFIWNKPNFGTGDFPRAGHETCLIYARGRGSLRNDRPQNVHSVQLWSQPRGNGHGGKIHSAKPDGFYDTVELGFVGPYLELFARRQRLGWDTWGDEALQHVDLAVAGEGGQSRGA